MRGASQNKGIAARGAGIARPGRATRAAGDLPMRRAIRPLGLVLLGIVACHGDVGTSTHGSAVLARRGPENSSLLEWLRQYLARPRRAAAQRGAAAVLAGAGDIARCYPDANISQFTAPGPANPATQTARLLQE